MAKYVGTTDLSTLEDKYFELEYVDLEDDIEDWLEDDSPWEEDEED